MISAINATYECGVVKRSFVCVCLSICHVRALTFESCNFVFGTQINQSINQSISKFLEWPK